MTQRMNEEKVKLGLQRLLTTEGVDLASVPRADAYIALFPYLNKLVLPEGVADLAKDRPSANVSLFAPKASLVVRRSDNETIDCHFYNHLSYWDVSLHTLLRRGGDICKTSLG